MDKLLQELLEEFQTKIIQFDGTIQREITLPNIPNKIIVYLIQSTLI